MQIIRSLCYFDMMKLSVSVMKHDSYMFKYF